MTPIDILAKRVMHNISHFWPFVCPWNYTFLAFLCQRVQVILYERVIIKKYIVCHDFNFAIFENGGTGEPSSQPVNGNYSHFSGKCIQYVDWNNDKTLRQGKKMHLRQHACVFKWVYANEDNKFLNQTFISCPNP